METGFKVIRDLTEIRKAAELNIPIADVHLYAMRNGFMKGTIFADYINGKWCFGYSEKRTESDISEMVKNHVSIFEMMAANGVDIHPQHFVFVGGESFEFKFWLHSMYIVKK